MGAWVKPPAGRLSPHFTWKEAACKCCGRVPSILKVRETATRLEGIRVKFGNREIEVHSWCRCPEHNGKVGGVPGSMHLKALAVDIEVEGLLPSQVQTAAAALKEVKGLGCYATFTHVDRRQGARARWRG